LFSCIILRRDNDIVSGAYVARPLQADIDKEKARGRPLEQDAFGVGAGDKIHRSREIPFNSADRIEGRLHDGTWKVIAKVPSIGHGA
jgi:hypothetical protein